MKTTFIYRQAMVNDADKSADIFSVFPRFPDTPGLIEQDFRLITRMMHNAESAVEVENGWDSDMFAILLLLLHLLPPSAQGRKRPGKMSASQAVDQLIRFQKVGISVQQHLDSITQSSQPYLLALGSTRSSIHSYFVVIDKHALPCKATGSGGAFDEHFKAHFVFGTLYSSCLNIFTFVQTTIYNIDMGETKETPRVAELRARMGC
ncbi:hypothetical protein MHYP_G00314390 [Metynnis hypsauchen]